MSKLKIAIAGATGFIGRELIERLKLRSDVSIRAISRSGNLPLSDDKVEWVQADLFSMLDIEKALSGIDIAIYLVHSMSPTASLDQGNFQDYDLILSDNFARAARKQELKQIIYLGGIIPETENLSPHLRSRLEVEQTLMTYGTPVTALRAGLIIGSGGSSFNMLLKLVDRLPIIPVPNWIHIESQPIDVSNVLDSILHCINNPFTFGRIFDLGGPEVLTYRQMLERVARKLNKKRWFIKVPFVRPFMIRWVLGLITGAPQDLVRPLVDSLKHTIKSRDERLLRPQNSHLISFEESIERAVAGGALRTQPHAYTIAREIEKNHDVRSVQRMHLPKGMRADAACFAYQHWLPRFMWPFLKVQKYNHFTSFHIWGFSRPLLELELSYQRSSSDRQLMYIKGGILARDMKRGRLEFREVLGGRYLIAAIHEFRPALPWWMYVHTQAPVHLIVMLSFDRWLKKVEKNRRTATARAEAALEIS